MKNIYQKLLEVLSPESPLALVTVTSTSGSTPQKPGSSAILGESRLIAGTIGGGAVEGKIQDMVKSVLPKQKSGLYLFDLDNDISDRDRGICGGEVEILVDAHPGDHISTFEMMMKSINNRIGGILVTQVQTAEEDRVSILRYWINKNKKGNLPQSLEDQLENRIQNLMASGSSGALSKERLTMQSERIHCYLELILPLPQLVIAGAGHIGRALSHLGNLLDFDVMVIDDRPEHANRDNLPDVDHIVVEPIGKALLNIEKEAETYIVIVTRGHKDDADALRACIGSSVAYIGMIGSSKKVALMHRKFIEEGWATEEQWKRIHAPIGLSIHSQTVQEIAISIAAQLIQTKRGRRASK